jgi:hypothetical protein
MPTFAIEFGAPRRANLSRGHNFLSGSMISRLFAFWQQLLEFGQRSKRFEVLLIFERVRQIIIQLNRALQRGQRFVRASESR